MHLDLMDRIHKNGLNNAHHAPGVLGWQQLQHACSHQMHFVSTSHSAYKVSYCHLTNSITAIIFSDAYQPGRTPGCQVSEVVQHIVDSS